VPGFRAIDGVIAKLLVDAIANAANSSVLAANGVRTLAVPSINTGAYGDPIEPATEEARAKAA
jgi:O-acetyl-ADP-ribose deacetylase (regulator of RNase III)